MTELHIFIGFIGFYIQLLAIIVGAVGWKKRSSSEKKAVLMIAVSWIIQLVAREVGKYYGNSMPLYHLSVLLEFCIIWWILKDYLKTEFAKYYINGIAIVYVIFFLFSATFLESVFKFPSYVRFGESLMIIALVISYFIGVLNQMVVPKLYRSFIFWFCTGLLIYYTATLVITLFASMLIDQKEFDTWQAVWSVHNGLNIFLYICFIVAFLIERKPKKDHNLI